MDPSTCKDTLGTDAIPTAGCYPFTTAARVVVQLSMHAHKQVANNCNLIIQIPYIPADPFRAVLKRKRIKVDDH